MGRDARAKADLPVHDGSMFIDTPANKPTLVPFRGELR